jgi:hypothetical protein
MIADPYGQRASDRAATIVIMIIADPKWITAHLGSNGSTKAGAGFEPCGHTSAHAPVIGEHAGEASVLFGDPLDDQ